MKRSLILLSLLVALIPSSAGSWGVMGMSGGTPTCEATSFPDTFCGSNGSAPTTNLWHGLIRAYSPYGDYWDGTWDIQDNNLYLNANHTYSAGGSEWPCYATSGTLSTSNGRYFEITCTGSPTSDKVVLLAIWNSANDADCTGTGTNNIAAKAKNFVQVQMSSTSAINLYSTNSTAANWHLDGSASVTLSGTYTVRLTLVDATHCSVQLNGNTVIASSAITADLGSSINAGIYFGLNYTAAKQTYTITDANFQ